MAWEKQFLVSQWVFITELERTQRREIGVLSVSQGTRPGAVM